jgi:outer membrane receptor for ferrienterochelin and colicin
MKSKPMIRSLFLLFIGSLYFQASGQSKFTISGYIEDAGSGEKLISATIFNVKNQQGVVSNTYGFYSLTLPAGEVDLFASYVGYANWEFKLDLNKDTVIHITLTNVNVLQEVIIHADQSDRADQKIQMSQITIPIDQIKKAPALLGEVDVLKILQLLPGVQGGTEGQNGLYVRGGSPDQNLILLDGVPVYNVSHIGGFFSVFNGDAIKNVTLTKGGFPARHGGRLSSVIEIDMKEGNMKEFHGEGGIGLISSRLTLEGPIWKDKISFLISGRRTYLDLIARPFIASSIKHENKNKETQIGIGIDAHFYDLNAKVNYKINDRHRIFFSAYNGLDIFGAQYDEFYKNRTEYDKTKGGLDWGNITSAFRWNWMIHPKLFANTTITYSKYNVDIGAQSETKRIDAASNKDIIDNNLAKYLSGIRDWAAKADLDYIINPMYRVRSGLGISWHKYSPGAFQVKAQSTNINIDTLIGSKDIHAVEPFAYVENEFQLGTLKANIGLHFSAFGVEQKWYGSMQPRISFHYSVNNTTALKASFVTMRQYINLLTNERIGLPTDLWVPSTKRIMPQFSWQAALG